MALLLKEWREYRRLSRRELATRAGLDAAVVDDVESGKRAPDPATVRALAAALEVVPRYLSYRPGSLAVEQWLINGGLAGDPPFGGTIPDPDAATIAAAGAVAQSLVRLARAVDDSDELPAIDFARSLFTGYLHEPDQFPPVDQVYAAVDDLREWLDWLVKILRSMEDGKLTLDEFTERIQARLGDVRSEAELRRRIDEYEAGKSLSEGVPRAHQLAALRRRAAKRSADDADATGRVDGSGDDR